MLKGNCFKSLVNEVQSSFKYCYDDAEIYARKLVDLCIVEYKQAYKEDSDNE